MLTKIVHRTRDCVGVIAGVQQIDGPPQVKYWVALDPCDLCGVDACAYNSASQLHNDPYKLLNVCQAMLPSTCLYVRLSKIMLLQD